MRAAGFTDPAFARIAELAHLVAGLVFPPNRQPSAEAGMRRAMTALRITEPDALLRAVALPGHVRDLVLAELTIGESYFFRDSAQLNVLATDILPSRIAQYGVNRPLRVWSAGCASGEEPYTVAIALRELGWPHPARILGTDIATHRLDVARRGRYSRWALRGVSEERVTKWFRQRGSTFDLDRSIVESVEFRTLNLVGDDHAPAQTDGHGYDLVLCRNVMIYFGLEAIARIATRLLDSLAPDGWLVLGASDPLLAQLVPCDVVMTAGGVAYRRAGVSGDMRESRSFAPLRTTDSVAPPRDRSDAPYRPPEQSEGPVFARPTASVHREAAVPADSPAAHVGEDSDLHAAYQRNDYALAESMAVIALASAAVARDTHALWILYIRAVANQGRLHEAGALCLRALEAYPMVAELHYLHAMLLAEAGWPADAAHAARRSIYLDRNFVMGHLLLGDALTRVGDASGARIAFANVVRLLSDAEPILPITGSDRVPASRLRQVAMLRLRELAARSPSNASARNGT